MNLTTLMITALVLALLGETLPAQQPRASELSAIERDNDKRGLANLADARQRAERGDAAAQVVIGMYYLEGFCVAKDPVEAVKWFRKAAAQGDAEAQCWLGACYSDGRGVAQDRVTAAKWFCKAADQSSAHGQHLLGLCYAWGDGVPKDAVLAYKWILLSAWQRYPLADKSLVEIAKNMSRDEISEGQELARAFVPRQVPSTGSDTSSASIAQTRPESSGTGFFITDDGFVVTNEHVVGEAGQLRLLSNAGMVGAKVVKVDEANDLALLKAEGRFLPLPVAASRGARLGSTVATVGFPNIGLQGFAPKLAKGEIAALTGIQDDPRYFQISVPLQPGNSGGALVDSYGNVVGVVSAKLSIRAALATSGTIPENVNYAVKSSLLLSFLESVPDVASRLKESETRARQFEDVVKAAEQAAVLVLVY